MSTEYFCAYNIGTVSSLVSSLAQRTDCVSKALHVSTDFTRDIVKPCTVALAFTGTDSCSNDMIALFFKCSLHNANYSNLEL